MIGLVIPRLERRGRAAQEGRGLVSDEFSDRLFKRLEDLRSRVDEAKLDERGPPDQGPEEGNGQMNKDKVKKLNSTGTDDVFHTDSFGEPRGRSMGKGRVAAAGGSAHPAEEGRGGGARGRREGQRCNLIGLCQMASALSGSLDGRSHFRVRRQRPAP